MKRYQPDEKNRHIHDLVIVGGGIYGASMAYTATLNGIDVALFERDDFAGHTSANSQKVIHGGIRYLQSLDLKRVAESIREKDRFRKLFPHLVQPLPCVFPTSGYLTQGNEAFRLGFFLYSMLEKWVCKVARKKEFAPKILAREELVRLFPHLQESGARGGAMWYDGICLEPERVIFSLLKAAVQRGCRAANYMEVRAFTRQKDGLFQVDLYDSSAGRNYQLLTRKIALCTGAWFQDKYGEDELPSALAELSLIRGVNLIVPSLFSSATSLATKIREGASSRFLFVVPWKKYSIEGTDWEDCISPAVNWDDHLQKANDFHHVHQKVLGKEGGGVSVLASHIGYVPGYREEGKDASKRVLSHYRLVDREKERNGDLLQVVGVKFTTAFDVVFKALEQLYPGRTIRDVLGFDDFPSGSFAGDSEKKAAELWENCKEKVSRAQYETIFQLFGEELNFVLLQYIEPLAEEFPCSEKVFYKGLARYCIEQEMSLHLADIVWRRLFPDHPEPVACGIMETLAEEMKLQLGWTVEQKEEEIRLVQKGRGFS